VLLDDVTAVVAAVVTSTDDAFVAIHLLTEGVLSARKEEEHGGSTPGRARSAMLVEQIWADPCVCCRFG
jgi:hypothetical protein